MFGEGEMALLGSLYCEVPCLGVEWDLEALYGEVQCIMGNGHMAPLYEQNDRETPLHHFVGGGNKNKM